MVLSSQRLRCIVLVFISDSGDWRRHWRILGTLHTPFVVVPSSFIQIVLCDRGGLVFVVCVRGAMGNIVENMEISILGSALAGQSSWISGSQVDALGSHGLHSSTLLEGVLHILLLPLRV